MCITKQIKQKLAQKNLKQPVSSLMRSLEILVSMYSIGASAMNVVKNTEFTTAFSAVKFCVTVALSV